MPAFTTIGAGLAGLVIVLTHGASPTWMVLFVLAGLTAVAIVWSGEIANMLLYGLVLTAPIAITRSISARGGVYGPGLELSLVDLFLMCLLVVWAVEIVLRRTRVQAPPPGGGVVLAICAWAWVSGLLAEDWVAGVFAAMNQTKFLLEFVIVYNMITTSRVLRRVLIAAGVGLTLNLLMMTAQTVAKSPLAVQGAKAASSGIELVYPSGDGVRAFRPSGFLLHPNAFADYLVIVLPVPIVLVLLGKQRVGQIAWWFCLTLAAAGTLALILTMSRGGWISFAVAIAFALAVSVRRNLLTASRVAAAIGVATATLAMVIAVYPAVLYRITMSDNRSTETRLVMIDQAAMIIRENMLFGVGLGNYTRASRRYTPEAFAPLQAEYQNIIRSGVVHNGYLLIWSERGLVGLLLHLLVLATALVRFHRVREWRDPVLHAVGIGLLAGVIGQGTFYLFDHFHLDLRPGVFWLLLGVSASVLKMQALQARMGGRVHAGGTAACPC